MKIMPNRLDRGFTMYQAEFEEKALEVLRSGWYILGKEVRAFEEEFAAYIGAKYCVGLASGLDALWIAFRLLNIGAGDEVIVQANGYIATMLGITQNGGVPVFVDSDEYHNIDPQKIEAAITSKTKAVLVTHLYGMSTRMDEILDICNRHGLMLFEDCAQSHFSSYKGKNTGLFGKAGFYSFYPTKNLGGFGDGGGIVSKDKDFIDRIKTLRNYGSDYKYHNIELGFKYTLT